MDCDGQHEPARIPVLLEAIHDADIVSASRYLRDFRQDTPAPVDRRSINTTITREINARYGLNITDAFCGFKAYRRRAVEALRITEPGWGMPLELWVQAASIGLRIKEVAVPRLYLDPSRAFGGVLNNPEERLEYYRRVLADAERAMSVPECPLAAGCWEPCV
jgi:dolichol-phosphate mannosyltransferase